MLIPEFKITQNQTHIIVVIRVPYIKVSSCEFYIEETTFKFYLKPYLLSLSFEQPLKEAEEPEKATYYHEKHLLEVTLQKKNKGEFFDNLNLLSNVMSKSKDTKQKNKKVLVQVIGEAEHQEIEEKEQDAVSSGYGYGFCGNYENVFKNLEEQTCELFSFNPEQIAAKDRNELSKKLALEDFDDNTYLFDKISNFQEIDRIIESKEAEVNLLAAVEKFKGSEPPTYEEFRKLLKIPAKELLITKQAKPSIIKQLVSIAVCYVYELICMEGDLGVESQKTINRTSGVLNCLADYREQDLQQVILDTARRCIVYSLYKHLELAQKAVQIVCKYLSQDLLTFIVSDLRAQFQKCQPRYLLNTIFLDDFLIYLLSSKLQQEIEGVKVCLAKVEVSEQNLQLEVENQEMDASNNNNLSGELEDLLSLI